MVAQPCELAEAGGTGWVGLARIGWLGLSCWRVAWAGAMTTNRVRGLGIASANPKLKHQKPSQYVIQISQFPA